MQLIKASRKSAKIRMGLQGPSGSGKSIGALKIASGMTKDWSKVAVIDTEFHSADLYAHLGNYQVLHLEPPFSPERYIAAIEVCEKAGMEVIIIDSISHEWDGEGGILSIHNKMTGNSFTSWGKLTPRHNAFVNKILNSSAHIIATIRTKQEYVLSKKADGKYVPEKMGLKGITRDGLDYELTIVFDVDIKHQATCSKDRTGLFASRPPFELKEKLGEEILKWCETGESLDDILKSITQANTPYELKKIYAQYPQFKQEMRLPIQERHQEIQDSIINPSNLSANGTTADSNQQ